jgi:hypothetical protein
MITRLGRRAAAAAALAAASLGLAGCLNIVDERAAQQGIGHVVRITATACLDGADANSCAKGDAAPGEWQPMLAVRVPAGATAPATLTAKRPEGDLRLTAHAGYTAELERIEPAGAGMQWLGYVSEPAVVPVTFPEPGTPEIGFEPAAIALDVALPEGALPATFRYQLVPGYRRVEETLPADRAVVCPAPDAPDPETYCLDAFDPGVLTTFHEVALTDAVVTAPAETPATPGATVTLPFSAGFTGAPAGVLALAASTDLPGGATALAAPKLAPAPGQQAAPVTLTVPAGAAPGRYAVTLSAALGAESRSATASVVVTPAPAQDVTKPALSAFAAKGKPTRRSVARRGLRIGVVSAEPVTAVATLRAGKPARRTLRVKRPALATARTRGSGALTLKLTLPRPVAKRLGAARTRVRLSVRLAATDAAGNRTERTLPVTLR